jgi:translation elongation factor P/translation initiation factor 5A
MASTSLLKMYQKHDIYKIIEFLHVKPGKGPAFNKPN